MNRSEQINELAAAMAKAQARIEGAAKDKTNPAFRSKYADLGAVWDAVRAPLSDNGLAVVQFPRKTETGIEVETVLMHSSGQWMSDTLAFPISKPDAHGHGGGITYARRFSLQSICGVAPVDDDGNAAAGKDPDVMRLAPKNALRNEEGELLSTYASDVSKKAKDWADAAISSINLSDTAGAIAWVRAADEVPKGKKKSPLQWLEDNAPDQFVRVNTAYTNVTGEGLR